MPWTALLTTHVILYWPSHLAHRVIVEYDQSEAQEYHQSTLYDTNIGGIVISIVEITTMTIWNEIYDYTTPF